MKRREFLRRASLAPIVAAGLSSIAPVARAAALPPHAFYANEFPSAAGGDTSFRSYLGKPVVLNFWATWCPPCVKEMPDLDALHKKYPGVQFVGLAVDTAANVEKFGQKVKVSYPLLIAGHGGIKLMRELGNKNGGLPFTVVFDKDGRYVRHYLGQIKPEELDAYIAGMS
ncbi:MAG: TlpA disulfide reductase family protein [Alcaligenaceae bacterium]|nr:TlpA disulfide reductase family protein [Alcaligenaceae bacterium]